MTNVASKAAVIILSWRGPSGNLITEGPRYDRNKQVATLKAMRNATVHLVIGFQYYKKKERYWLGCAVLNHLSLPVIPIKDFIFASQ